MLVTLDQVLDCQRARVIGIQIKGFTDGLGCQVQILFLVKVGTFLGERLCIDQFEQVSLFLLRNFYTRVKATSTPIFGHSF